MPSGVGTSHSHDRITRATGVNKRMFLQTSHDFDFDVIKCNESRKSYNCRTPTINKYRTVDGTCNNLRRPLLGASNTAFRRVLSAVYDDGVFHPVGLQQYLRERYFDTPWPSARYLSGQIVIIENEINSKTLTHMNMQWGQFLDHDLDLLGMFDVNCTEVDNDIRFCFPIKIQYNDKDFGESSINKAKDLPLRRSLPVCPPNHNYNYYSYSHRRPSRSGYTYEQSYDDPYHHPNGHSDHQSSHHISPRSHGSSYREYYHQSREHINRVTHFIDASMIYGSNKETQEAMRYYSGGRLKSTYTGTGKGDLPYSTMKDSRGVLLFMAGDERVNENTGLVVMQTLFNREHNRIAKELSKINPCWGDEELYQETRKIIGAIIQIITYEEYLPALYGEKWFDFYIGKYKRYSSYISPTVSNVFAAALFRYGHSQIRRQLSRYDKRYKPLRPLDLEHGFFNPGEYYRSGYTDPILRGLLIDAAGEVDEFISEGVASFLITEPTSVIATDLTALNIQRGRDHALPSYRQWEELCISKFGNRPSFKRSSTITKFKRLYGDYGFRYGMDLWLAGLAEKHLDGSSIGPTFACLLAETFKSIRDGDRFWWERPRVFTVSQRNTLSKVTLSQVICESSDGIERIQPNAFKLHQGQTRCSRLPKLDLSQWNDHRC